MVMRGGKAPPDLRKDLDMPKQRQDAAQHIQGGVLLIQKDDRRQIDTKSELKELIESSPHRVYFYATAQFPPQKGMVMMVSDVKLGQKLVIVGPDPHTTRTWYANIERTARGLRVT